MTLETIIAGLDEPAAVLWDLSASCAALAAAAEKARAVVRGIDEGAAASERRAQALAAMTPRRVTPGQLLPLRSPVAEVIAKLEAIDLETRKIACLREIAAALGAQLDARAKEAAQVEAARDEARKPLRAQTERAENLAKRAADFPALAEQIIEILRIDVRVARIGGGVLTNAARAAVPRDTLAHSVDIALHIPPTLAVDEILSVMKIPHGWPPSYWTGNHASFLNQWNLDLDDEQADHEILGPLRQLSRKGGAISEAEAERAVARAQTEILARYRNATIKIEEILRLDSSVTSEDRALRYPDGAPVFDPRQFPPGWRLGAMRSHVVLPSFRAALAAE